MTAPMIGRNVSHYRILEKLGGGGMGEVYLAEDTRLHRRVALKVLPAGMATDPERLERFAREAKAIGGLNHPNIVTIHAIEESEGLQLLVMELIEGRTLAEEIPPGGLSEKQFFELAIPLADAVSAAHDRGVTHRDLKPSNVMLTGDGRVKVVDFGLAKLRQEAQTRERTIALDEDLTEEGRVLGTYPYMAPEQVKGRPVDHRSDIFSLGVVLYEMATGHRPFAGETSADLISAILRDTPDPVQELNSSLPRHVDRIIAHCLEKDPDRRFQTAKDLRNELQSLQRELESDRLLRSVGSRKRISTMQDLDAPRATGPGRRRLAVGAVLLAAVVAAGAFVYPRLGERPGDGPSPRGPASSEAASVEERPSLAILFFRNLTGDPELEWLRTGLTEMLVTDLSQSPGLRVVSTDQVYQILAELDGLDDPFLSADVVREVADRVSADTVLIGSYVQAGDTLQVNVTLKDTSTGEILDAERVQGPGESSVFDLADRLSGVVRQVFERSGRLARQGHPVPERSIESVTTSSVDAYRLYAEGMRLNQEFKIEEAIALFERAVELDPGFAMAYARLARIYETLGREGQLARALDQAMAHADRLPTRERLYIEGLFFGRKRATYDRAIRALEEAVDLYPDHHSARYQLGLLYTYVELSAPAVTQFEETLRRGWDYDGAYNALATTYETMGRPEDARRLLRNWASERWSEQLVVAWHATTWGDTAEALDALRRAEAARPHSPFIDFFRWRIALLEGRWDQARDHAEALAEGSSPYWAWRGLTGLALEALYRGRSEEALSYYDRASRAYGDAEPLIGTGRNLAAEALLALDRPSEALEEAGRAQRVAEGDWPAREGLFWATLATERLGRGAEANRLAGELAATSDLLPGTVERRFHHRLLGRLAAERGDTETAIRELTAAEDLLPPRGILWHRHRLPDHVPLWYELATVHREARNATAAEERYRRIVSSGTEHTYHPIQYVRSHYFLGRLLEERGDRSGARGLYRTFLDLWGEGDLDRDRVADARARLAALE